MARCTLALLVVASLGLVARAQSPQTVLIQEPVAFRVYQRDRNDRADIPVTLNPRAEGASIVSAKLSGLPVGASSQFAGGKFSGIPTGGPYQVSATVRVGGKEQMLTVGSLFVGDLWVLAGQSNMIGYGDLVDVTPPHPKVMVLGADGYWAQAREPLHREIDARAGLGLPFAVTLVRQTKVPIGLVLCAGGGSMEQQWNPARKGEGTRSRYGAMLQRVQRAGGRVKGLLWWHGENEGEQEKSAKSYPTVFPAFIAAVRRDFHQPDLPVYFVQVSRLVYDKIDPKARNPVREVQRRIPERVPHTAVVAAIDLELDDLGHVGTDGLKRVGRRLALVALRELYGQQGATTPNLDKILKVSSSRGLPDLVVKWKGVNVRGVPPLGLQPARHIAGFSIRRPDGSKVPLIFEAAVGPTPDSVTLKLYRAIPKGVQLWYGYGLDPYCNLTDSLDMAVPAFGPVPLDDLK
jgi:sialate O-acetylesterase